MKTFKRYFLIRKKPLFILICFAIVFNIEKIFAQNISCVDTLTTSLYSSNSLLFSSTPIFISIPAIDNGMINLQGYNSYADSILLFKIDNNRNVAWAKKIRQYSNMPWQSMQELNNGDIIINSENSANSSNCQTCIFSNHLLLDKNGNVIYGVNYINQNGDDGWLICNSGPTQSIVFAGIRLATNGGGILVDRFDTLLVPPLTLNERWRNSFSANSASPISYSPSSLFVVENYIYIGGTYIDTLNPLTDAGIWMLKLDYNTGYIIDQKYYQLTNNASSDKLAINSSAPIAKSLTNKFTFTVQISHSSTSKTEIGYIQLDENLNISNSPIAVSTIALDGTNAYPILNQTGTSLYYLPEWHGFSYFAFIDSTNKLTTEQYNVTNIVNNTIAFQYNLKNNNNINIGVSTGMNSSGNYYLQLSDITPDFVSRVGCITDTNVIFASSRLLPIEKVNLNLGITLTPDIVTLSVPQPPITTDFVIANQVICQQTSICDIIKINGNNNFCFSDSLYNFTATKNNQCLKKTNWLADTNFVAVIKQFNDTSVSLQFKNTGKTFLYATVAGCGITDSLLITIKKPASKVDIGNDTTLCPNATDSLFTKFAYQKYLWQNGSADPFFIVKNAGTYYVTTTDNCNHISSDTVVIKYIADTLSAGNDIEICKLQDTALNASDGFINYTWQPADSIIGSALSQRVVINPVQTTTYIVTAQTATGCTLSDTVQVLVNNCLNKLIMPTAFTPNHDGINDIIHPIVYGVLEKYNFSIYNRWGQLVFQSTKQSEGWNGTINNNLQTAGTFVWQCNYQFTGEKEKSEKGTFILIR